MFADQGADMARRWAKWAGSRALGRARQVERGGPGRIDRMMLRPGFEIPDAFLRPDDRCPQLTNQFLKGCDRGRDDSTERGRNTTQHPTPVNGYTLPRPREYLPAYARNLGQQLVADENAATKQDPQLSILGECLRPHLVSSCRDHRSRSSDACSRHDPCR